MSNNEENEKIAELSIKTLLSEKVRYRIPRFQRNYAWGEEAISQLIQDVIDYMNSNDKQDQNYYIGTLIVFEKKDEKYYEVIDGQQRLTTLVLLIAYLKHSGELAKCLQEDTTWEWLDDFNKENRPIHFWSRQNSQETLEAIFEEQQGEETQLLSERVEEALKKTFEKKRNEETELHDYLNIGILNGYRDIEGNERLQEFAKDPQELKEFCDFLLERVKIMRVPLPEGTDLSHYFEIMNNRGEQLEKHEILKARMIAALHDEQSRSCFSIVWDTCANMGHYVQIGFSEEQRNAVFGENWDSFCVKDFEELQEKISPKISNDSNKRTEYPTLSQIINSSNQNGDDNDNNQNGDKNDKENENNDIEFNTIIDFPKFLLHVLRVQTKEDISLNDNELIPKFAKYILNDSNGDSKKVKEFAYNLLLCKFLYDQYIIKINPDSSDETGRWSLKRLKKQNDNSESEDDEDDDTFGVNSKRIIMLLSSLHVSETGPTKYWLDASLNHLVGQWEENQNIEAKSYLKHMEEVATSFVFDRSLSPNSDLDYFSIIYKNNCECQMKKEELSEEHIKKRLSYGHIPRRIFHFLDYLLWLKYKDDRNYPKIKIFKEGNFPKITDFEFTTSNNSVEHHFPQNPEGGGAPLPPEKLHSFGNLYLISRSKNSELSNKPPREKKKKYEESGKIGSIKQYLMMMKDYQTKGETSISNKEGETDYKWDESIDAHDKEMRDLLLHWLETGTVETENPKDEEKEEHWK